MKTKYFRGIVVLITILILIAGCKPEGISTPTIKATALPDGTLSPEAVSLPAPTLSSQELPALERITLENVDRVQLLATLSIPDLALAGAYHGQCGVAFSPDGSLLAGTCGKNSLPIWNVPSLELKRTLFNSPDHTISCDFSPDSQMIACGKYGGDWAIPAWDSKTGEYLNDIGYHMSSVWDVDFSPDGQYLASCSLSSAGDVRLWKVSPPESLWIHEPGAECLSVSFHPDGDTIATGGKRGKVEILDVKTGNMIALLEDTTRNIGDLTYSPSGGLLAAGCDDNNILIWDTTDYSLFAKMSGHKDYVNGVVFSADETFLVSGSGDRTVAIWDLNDLRIVKHLIGHEKTVLRVDINPENTLIASVSWDGTVRLWGVLAE